MGLCSASKETSKGCAKIKCGMQPQRSEAASRLKTVSFHLASPLIRRVNAKLLADIWGQKTYQGDPVSVKGPQAQLGYELGACQEQEVQVEKILKLIEEYLQREKGAILRRI